MGVDAWIAVSFVLFLVMVFTPAKKALVSGLDNKIANIKQEIDESERIKEDATVALS